MVLFWANDGIVIVVGSHLRRNQIDTQLEVTREATKELRILVPSESTKIKSATLQNISPSPYNWVYYKERLVILTLVLFDTNTKMTP